MSIKIDNYLIGGASFLGAFLSNFSVSLLSRRAVLLTGHFFTMMGHIFIYTFIQLEMGSNSVLFSMIVVILSF